MMLTQFRDNFGTHLLINVNFAMYAFGNLITYDFDMFTRNTELVPTSRLTYRTYTFEPANTLDTGRDTYRSRKWDSLIAIGTSTTTITNMCS